MSNKIPADTYKGHGVEGSAQQGFSGKDNVTETVSLDLDIDVDGEIRRVSTFLYFTEKAEKYSLERLEALGWDGSADPSFPGISRNEVEVKVHYPINPNTGEPAMKVEIVTGSGTAAVKEKMDEKQTSRFMSRIAKTPGAKSGGGAPKPGGGLAL